MRKIFGLTIAAVLVIGLVAGGTWAYFSDTETSTGNQFTAGTIDISVNGENPWSGTGYFTISDMKPCTVWNKDFTITNVGTNEADVWKRLTVTGTSGGLHPESELAEDPEDTINNIDTVINYDLLVDGEVIIAEADGLQISEISGYYIYLGKIEPGASMVVRQSYHMQADVTNWAQGDVMDFTIELYAQQISGCPTPPGTELSGYGKPSGTYVDFGNPLSERGHLNRDVDDWSYIGAWNIPDNTPGYLPHNHYGGYDGGNADFRGLMGAPTGCGAGHEYAIFVMNACPGPVTTLTLRHLDGQVNDSFDVQLRINGVWVTIGHYTAGTSGEHWVTSSYTLPGSLTGKLEFRLVATNAVGSWCAKWGQVMFNWAQVS